MGAIFSLIFMLFSMMFQVMFYVLRVTVMMMVWGMRLIGEVIENSSRRRSH